jgi:hypothetical protein
MHKFDGQSEAREDSSAAWHGMACSMCAGGMKRGLLARLDAWQISADSTGAKCSAHSLIAERRHPYPCLGHALPGCVSGRESASLQEASERPEGKSTDADCLASHLITSHHHQPVGRANTRKQRPRHNGSISPLGSLRKLNRTMSALRPSLESLPGGLPISGRRTCKCKVLESYAVQGSRKSWRKITTRGA